jgi:hypothetical protein
MGRKPSKGHRGSGKSNLPVEKDDGSRWVVIGENGRQVYLGSGIKKKEAQRLADGLVQSATLEMVVPPTEE